MANKLGISHFNRQCALDLGVQQKLVKLLRVSVQMYSLPTYCGWQAIHLHHP